MVYDSSDAGVHTITVNKPDLCVYSVPSETSASNTTAKSTAGYKVEFTYVHHFIPWSYGIHI